MRKFPSLLFAASMFAAAFPVTAANAAGEQPCYAILSLVGDKLDIAYFNPVFEGRVERSDLSQMEFRNDFLDGAAAGAAGASLARLAPGAELVRLTASSPALYDNQRELFRGGGRVELPAAIVAAMKNEKANYLVLITKVRDDADVQVTNHKDATDKVEGLGYYVDHWGNYRRFGFGQVREPRIASFMYAKISLIDASTSNVIRDRVIKGSRVVSLAGLEDDERPWFAMSTERKAREMESLVREEIARAMPELMRSR